MIVDIHTHAFPDELAARALTALVGNCDVPALTDGTVAGLRASMRQAGIDRSAVMPIATKPSQVRGINQWAADVNRQFEDIISFGTLHPLMEDWQAEIERLANDGIPGIKLHPDYQDFFVDDPSLSPIYRALADAGLILMMHAGVDIGLPSPVHCTPDRLANVLDTVPELTIIAAHMGGYIMWDDVEKYLVGRDVYFDTSYSMADLGRERMTALIRSHGVDKILFGTDSPWTDQAAEVAGIRGLPFSDEEIGAVLGGNAERVLSV